MAYRDVSPNPGSDDALRVRVSAAQFQPDLVVGLGGGSALDLAKAAAFLLSNGGSMRDYQGYDRAPKPLVPLIGIPTTTGTGSEAQSYCVISDSVTKTKMACGSPGAACRIALLDPEVALTQPAAVRGASGFDAIAHAVETWVTTKRNELSDMLAREAWELLSANYEAALSKPDCVLTIAAMQWGAFLAGWAIEQSMLGAAHACANPLTSLYGTTHAHALAVVLPHVIRFNREICETRYRRLDPCLEQRLAIFAEAGGLPRTLRELGVEEARLPELAADASNQWTGRFNPRPFDAAAALEIYRCAY
jgi:alcohol dehydrogenase